ncbi:ribosome biogenesis GTP-binding protein YihA/YsxC [Candidatus Mycoplasma pogonae]
MWKFIKSAQDKNSWYQHEGKEICFIGRSNVGKSSLINALANTKIAKTSNTPGRTQLINYFSDDYHNIVVDLPGYGYAKMSKSQKQKMLDMIEQYFIESTNLATVFLLFDSVIGPTEFDFEMYYYLQALNRKVILVGTKVDKAKQSQLYKAKKALENLAAPIYWVSANKKTKIAELRDAILSQF